MDLGKNIPSRGNTSIGILRQEHACCVCEDKARVAALERGRGWAGDGEEGPRSFRTLAF